MREAASASVKNLNDGHRAIGEAVIMLTRKLETVFGWDNNLRFCCGLQKLDRAYDAPRVVVRLIAQKLSNVTVLQNA